MAIQWFPGHMAKAKKEVQEKLKQVDLVLEIVDARTPESSRNPMLNEIIGEKPRIMVLNKADLADPNKTAVWIQHYQDMGYAAMAIDAQHARQLKQIPQLARQLMAEKIARKKARGIKNPAVRAMCIGIPNVGKSTILNRLVKKNIAITGNKPGVTKNQQWLKADDSFQVLDTPGILWPKFEDQAIGLRLALTGAIADAVFQEDVVGMYGLEFFMANYPNALKQAYHLTADDLNLPSSDLMVILSQRNGFADDYNRMAERLIFDARQGKLGRYTLELPGDNDADAE
ncbi:ribosome biogenesis GTPase YlqF [Lacticaseibacillus brantae]|uniref:Ribosome biogenesis GTPase A n=1 Tax=Lacticaseibacillus brantae DSM 23927 TaxID=1423727 RepID=A0A0R2AZ96_9LACO|nr:ribosome biogenesis GTPase YlqF [Lacticaseibacillus brantae]KRM72621.1 GTPase [Lacticaseibacillus brantae DSM 23927]